MDGATEGRVDVFDGRDEGTTEGSIDPEGLSDGTEEADGFGVSPLS